MIEYDKRYMGKCSSLLAWAKDRLDAGLFAKSKRILSCLEVMNGYSEVLAYPKLQLKILNLLASTERHLRQMKSAFGRLNRCLEICDTIRLRKGRDSHYTMCSLHGSQQLQSCTVGLRRGFRSVFRIEFQS